MQKKKSFVSLYEISLYSFQFPFNYYSLYCKLHYLHRCYMAEIVQAFDNNTKGLLLVYSYFQTYISALYHYIASQTSGTGNASNTRY